MKTIPIYCKTFTLDALVDDEDFDSLSQHKWKGLKPRNKWYAYRHDKFNGNTVTVYMHRQVLGLLSIDQTDHIDGNGLNNQKHNLRPCNHSQNGRNRGLVKSRNKTGFKGVCVAHYGKRYVAYIGHKNRRIRVGAFDSPEDASNAYSMAANRLHGEFARLTE